MQAVPSLLPKLLACILALAVIGLSLLVIRQQRYLLAADISRDHRALQDVERQSWELQSHIARRIMPQRLEELAEQHHLTHSRHLPGDAWQELHSLPAFAHATPGQGASNRSDLSQSSQALPTIAAAPSIEYVLTSLVAQEEQDDD